MRPISMIFSLWVLVALACAADDTCERAARRVEKCTGFRPTLPEAATCTGTFRAEAEQALAAESCADLAASTAKADEGGGLCGWLGWFCGENQNAVSLEKASEIAGLGEVCPSSRQDPLCTLMRNAMSRNREEDWTQVRDEVRRLVDSGDRADVVADAAVRFFLRERSVALMAWSWATRLGAQVPPAKYGANIDKFLRAYYPNYHPEMFKLAHVPMRPLEGAECVGDTKRTVVVFFPGVVRARAKDEWNDQIAALESRLPCVEAVSADTGTFMAPTVNAAAGAKALEAMDPNLPVHMVGYSQGARNMLETLVAYPEIAVRTRTALAMNSAAHGSQVGDLFWFSLSSAPCENPAPGWQEMACDAAKNAATWLRDHLAALMGVAVEALDLLVGTSDVLTYLTQHRDGVHSLTTSAAADFWANRAQALPTSTLFFSFRSAIRYAKSDYDLPKSNLPFFTLLSRAGGDHPHNDMQVLLTLQSLAGPVQGREVVMPVAQGNHWQWELPPSSTKGAMSDSMAKWAARREVIVGHFQALAEVGLLY